MENIFRVASHVCTVLSADRLVILDLQRDSFMGLNKSATAMWLLLSQEMPLQDIVNHLAVSYAIDEQRLAIDLRRFIREMEAMKLIEPVRNGSLPSDVHLTSSLPHITITSALLALEQVHEYIILPGGFLRLTQHIHDIFAPGIATANDSVVIDLSHDIKNAAYLVPFPAACLHQSITLCWMLRLKGIDAHVVIGVYLFPFSAHVWVESGRQIIQWEAGMGPYPDAKRIQAMSVIFRSGEMHTEERRVAP